MSNLTKVQEHCKGLVLEHNGTKLKMWQPGMSIKDTYMVIAVPLVEETKTTEQGDTYIRICNHTQGRAGVAHGSDNNNRVPRFKLTGTITAPKTSNTGSATPSL